MKAFGAAARSGSLRRMMLALGLALAGACATGEQVTEERAGPKWRTLDGEPPIVIAHRGLSGKVPEHTLEAYSFGVDYGADAIEPDLVFTKDGVLVARHDRYLSISTDVADHAEFADRKRPNDDAADAANRSRIDWWVEDFTLAELKTLRARQTFSGRSKAIDDMLTIPTFEEILSLASRKSEIVGRPIGVYPETKHPAFYAAKGYGFEARLLDALASFDAGPVFIQSFEPEILKRLKGKSKAKLVQLVFEETPGAGPNIPLADVSTYADGVGAAKGLVLSNAAGSRESLRRFVEAAHALGLFVHGWTLRDEQPNEVVAALKSRDGEAPAELADAFAAAERASQRRANPLTAFEEAAIFVVMGVDGLFCDFPNTCRAALDELAPPGR